MIYTDLFDSGYKPATEKKSPVMLAGGTSELTVELANLLLAYAYHIDPTNQGKKLTSTELLETITPILLTVYDMNNDKELTDNIRSQQSMKAYVPKEVFDMLKNNGGKEDE